MSGLGGVQRPAGRTHSCADYCCRTLRKPVADAGGIQHGLHSNSRGCYCCCVFNAGLGQERTALRSRVDVLTAELAAAREGSADLRLRLEHFTGPGGPQARVKQLEAALQLVSLLVVHKQNIYPSGLAYGKKSMP